MDAQRISGAKGFENQALSLMCPAMIMWSVVPKATSKHQGTWSSRPVSSQH